MDQLKLPTIAAPTPNDVEEQEEQRRRDEHALDQAGHRAKGKFTDRREMDGLAVLISTLCANGGKVHARRARPEMGIGQSRPTVERQDRV